MDNPEKLATQGKEDEEKQNKNTTQYVLDTTFTMRMYYNRLIYCYIETLLKAK